MPNPKNYERSENRAVGICPICGTSALSSFVCDKCCTERPWSVVAQGIWIPAQPIAEARMRLFDLGERLRAEGKLSMWTADKGGEPIVERQIAGVVMTWGEYQAHEAKKTTPTGPITVVDNLDTVTWAPPEGKTKTKRKAGKTAVARPTTPTVTFTESALAQWIFVSRLRLEIEARAVERDPRKLDLSASREAVTNIMWGLDFPDDYPRDTPTYADRFGLKKAERLQAEEEARFVFASLDPSKP